MSDGKWYEFFSSSNESKRSVRKILTTILLIIMIVGYSFLIITNILIVFSIKDIKIEPDEFELTIPTNETIVLEGTFIIDNDHWNSFDIRNLKIEFAFYSDNNTYLIGDTYQKGIIPRLKISEITVNLGFNFSETPNIFMILNETEYLEMELSVEFYYVFYRIYFEIKYTIDPFE